MTDSRSPSEKRPDPTRMANQPALTTSSGAVWIIVGALFVLASAYPLSALLVFEPGAAFPLAVATAATILVLYVLIILTPLFVRRGRRRLRMMDAFFIAMVALAVVGLVACVALQSAGIGG